MADFQLCCVRTHCSFLSSKKIQTTSQKPTPETSLTFKGDGWFCFSPMGMSFVYFIIEGTFFATEKSCYDAVYQVLMMHDLDLLLLLLIDLLQSSFYRSSSCSRSFLFLLLLSLYIFIIIEYTQIDIFGNKSSILCHTIMLKWKNKKEKRRNASMITCNLFLTTHYLIDYFFINKIFFIKARNSEWAYTTGISTSNKAFMHQTGTEFKLEKKIKSLFYFTAKFISNFD